VFARWTAFTFGRVAGLPHTATLPRSVSQTTKYGSGNPLQLANVPNDKLYGHDWLPAGVERSRLQELASGTGTARPQPAANGCEAGQPTPFYRGRLRSALFGVASGACGRKVVEVQILSSAPLASNKASHPARAEWLAVPER